MNALECRYTSWGTVEDQDVSTTSQEFEICGGSASLLVPSEIHVWLLVHSNSKARRSFLWATTLLVSNCRARNPPSCIS